MRHVMHINTPLVRLTLCTRCTIVGTVCGTAFFREQNLIGNIIKTAVSFWSIFLVSLLLSNANRENGFYSVFYMISFLLIRCDRRIIQVPSVISVCRLFGYFPICIRLIVCNADSPPSKTSVLEFIQTKELRILIIWSRIFCVKRTLLNRCHLIFHSFYFDKA